MHTRLLTLLNELSHQSTPLSGLWLLHGDEPLLSDWLIEACRPIWLTQHQAVQRLELSSPKSWYSVLQALTNLSLFDERTAIIVTGKHKPDPKDKALGALFEQFAQDTKDGMGNHLIWCAPKQDKKSLASKSLSLFNQHGLIIDGNIYDERTRGAFLRLKSEALGLNLDKDAWQTLLTATEHNLLSAYQTLWRLSFLPHDDLINTQTLKDALVAGADFNVFDVSDALLEGNRQKLLTILDHLKHTDTQPSLVLWALSKDARLILQIQAGKDASTLGIFQNKIHAYLQMAQRTQNLSHTWLFDIYEIDKAIKGIRQLDVWHLLKQLALKMCV